MGFNAKALGALAATILATLFVTSGSVGQPPPQPRPASETGAGLITHTAFLAGLSGGSGEQVSDAAPAPDASAAGEAQTPEAPAPSWSGGGSGAGGGGGGGGGGVVIGSTQQALINADRAGAGLAPLSWSGCLAGVAASNAQRMAAAGAISHADGPSRDLACGLGSSQAGENVGYWSGGVNDGQLNSMFMASPPHRANIMGPYRYVGTAWAVASDGKAYIAVEFA